MKTLHTIKATTRAQGRNLVKTIKAAGLGDKLTVKLHDNKQGDQRWSVQVNTSADKTLTAPRKPKSGAMVGFKQEVAHSAVKWLNERPSKNINVFIKRAKA